MHPEEQLSAYLDGELGEAERVQIESHLETCPTCQSLLHELMELQQTLSSSMFSLSEPADLEDRVLKAVAHETRIRHYGKLWMYVPLLAAVVLVLLAIVAGPVVIRVIQGLLVIGKALLYTMSLALADLPIFAGVAVIVLLIVLVASILSLRKLLRSAAV